MKSINVNYKYFSVRVSLKSTQRKSFEALPLKMPPSCKDDNTFRALFGPLDQLSANKQEKFV